MSEFDLTGNSYTHEYWGKNGVLNHTKAVVANLRCIAHGVEDCKFEQIYGFSKQEAEEVIGVHDAGKAINPNTRMQHCNTKEIIKNFYNEKKEHPEITDEQKELLTKIANIFSIVVTQDPIGKLISTATRHEPDSIKTSACIINDSYLRLTKYKPNITREQYFNFVKAYFMCDAGSYYVFRAAYFEQPENINYIKLKPKYNNLLENVSKQFQAIDNGSYNPKGAIRVRYYNSDTFTALRDFGSWIKKHYKENSSHSVIILFSHKGESLELSEMKNKLTDNINEYKSSIEIKVCDELKKEELIAGNVVGSFILTSRNLLDSTAKIISSISSGSIGAAVNIDEIKRKHFVVIQ
ncbi:MAG: hypothetical protein QG673_2143 [Pseudomonadota bacterium]|nr:hypothetical protein [Pseudomonadota bacterium]